MRHVLMSLTEEEFKAMIKSIMFDSFKEFPFLFKENPEKEDEFLTAEQAAEFLKVALTNVYEKTSKRLIPFYKVGKKLYFKKSELEEWVNKGRVKTIKEIGQEVVVNLPKPKKSRKSE